MFKGRLWKEAIERDDVKDYLEALDMSEWQAYQEIVQFRKDIKRKLKSEVSEGKKDLKRGFGNAILIGIAPLAINVGLVITTISRTEELKSKRKAIAVSAMLSPKKSFAILQVIEAAERYTDEKARGYKLSAPEFPKVYFPKNKPA